MRAFEPQTPRELQVTHIEGRVPEALRGTFYRIGPASLTIGADANRHWFDGDGMVCAFRFGPEGVRFRNRYVETPWYAHEQAAGRRLYSSFATVAPGMLGHLRQPKNPANTNIVPFGEKLLALFEAGRPFSLDSHTLAPRGEETFHGTLPAWAGFSAHPHLDAKRGTLTSVGLGVRFGRRGPYAVAESWEASLDGHAVRAGAIPLRHPDVIHSVGLTSRHTVVLAGPYGLDVARVPELLLGRRAIFDCVRWRPNDPMVIYVADREGARALRQFELPASFMIHVANAFDDGDDVVVDAVLHPDAQVVESIRLPFTDPPPRPGLLTRLRLSSSGQVTTERLSEVGLEFPTVPTTFDGVAHRFVYAGQLERHGSAMRSSCLLKVDTVTQRSVPHDLGDGCVFGEPVFAPTPGATREDDGWVLSLVYEGADHHSSLVILRADSWREIARLHLPFHVPVGLHASFAQSGS